MCEPTEAPRWEPPPATLAGPGGEVHVWRFDLDALAPRAERLVATLSPDERERAERFRFDRDRLRFLAGRVSLRHLLARYTGTEPGRVAFRYGPRGKPELEGEAGAEGLAFNLSHAQGRALLAVTRVGRIGVDLERIRPMPDADRIVERFFSPRECAAFRALEPAARTEAFFRCWTRKEAFVKATGEGIAAHLDRFDVTLAPGEPARLLALDGDPETAAGWSLVAIDPGDDYIAAAATEGHPEAIRLFDWMMV